MEPQWETRVLAALAIFLGVTPHTCAVLVDRALELVPATGPLLYQVQCTCRAPAVPLLQAGAAAHLAAPYGQKMHPRPRVAACPHDGSNGW